MDWRTLPRAASLSFLTWLCCELHVGGGGQARRPRREQLLWNAARPCFPGWRAGSEAGGKNTAHGDSGDQSHLGNPERGCRTS